MNEKEKIYNKIIEEYNRTGSVKLVAEKLNTNTIKVRRVLITEGLWESPTSRSVGTLYEAGMGVKEIADKLCMSEKNVQSYMPYSRGIYGENRTEDSERSGEYRARKKNAADKQAMMDTSGTMSIVKEEAKAIKSNIPQIPNHPKRTKNEAGRETMLPQVLRLKFEIVAPHYTNKADLDMEPEEKYLFLKLAKAEKGIIREVLVPEQMTLHAMHYMIQRLFGWQNSHLHHFELSGEDFDLVTDKQKVRDYMDLCGTLFRFPESNLADLCWDDDYDEKKSINTWLKDKYLSSKEYRSVEDTYIRNYEKVKDFRDEYEVILKKKTHMTLAKLGEMVIFESTYNKLLEGIRIGRIFQISSRRASFMDCQRWSSLQTLLMQDRIVEYEELREDKEEYEAILYAMEELVTVRESVLEIEKAIRFGREAEVRDFYNTNPQKVLTEQRKYIKKLERILSPFFRDANPGTVPFAKELYYVYDYGDDWCVKIVCESAYAKKGRTFVDLDGEMIPEDLLDRISEVYQEKCPICIKADGINVMDDVGGLYGFEDFLRKINSECPEDKEETESLMEWAKRMGWTGKRKKPENVL